MQISFNSILSIYKFTKTSILSGNITLGTLSNTGEYLVMTGSGTKSIATSINNGTTWSGVSNSLFSTTGRDVKYGLQMLLAVGEGTNTIAVNYDGITWSGLGSPVFSGGSGYKSVWDDEKWIVVGKSATNTLVTWNGSSWTNIPNIFSIGGYDVMYDSIVPRYIAAGDGGNTVAISTNGTTWTGLGNIFTTSGLSVNGTASYIQPNLTGFVAVGYTDAGSPNSIAAFSTTGTTWQMASGIQSAKTALSTSGFSALAFNGDNLYVAGGINNTLNSLATSTDGGNSWTGRGAFNTYIPSLQYANGIFMGAGGSSKTIFSVNGIDWQITSNVPPTTNGGRGIGYANGRWIYGGVNTVSPYIQIYYSDNNGRNWLGGSQLNRNQAKESVYGESSTGQGVWVILGFSNAGNSAFDHYVGYSTDNGVNWTGLGTFGLGTSKQGMAIAYGNKTWMVALNGNNGENILIKASDPTTDTNWSTVLTNTSSAFTTIGGISYSYATDRWYISGNGANGYRFAISNNNNPESINDFTLITGVNFGTGSGKIISVNYPKPKYIVGGKGVYFMKGSVDGTIWFPIIDQPFGVAVNGICWSPQLNRWIAVGEATNSHYSIAYSNNGINWVGIYHDTLAGSSPSPFTIRGNKVIWNPIQSKFYAVGEGTTFKLASSSDGITWTGIATTNFVDISGMGITFNL